MPKKTEKNPDLSTVRIWVNRRGLSNFLGRELAIAANVREVQERIETRKSENPPAQKD